ncbi:MAG: ribose 5-phosphate isomerase B [Thermodesulfobacteriota bacterium]|nr:ribose 5-phosphate isomerase B [Thermodesulfobacteriota bacterium]
MKIGIACDHGGFTLKRFIKEALEDKGCEVVDLGTNSYSSVDYPDFALKGLAMLVSGECDRIILMCGTGIGMSICANRIPGVRGTLCSDPYTAKMSRLHNDSNCLILGGRVIGPGIAGEIVDVWLATPFEGGRHKRRLEKIESIPSKI